MNFVWLYEGKKTEELDLSIQLVNHFYPDAKIYIISTSLSLKPEDWPTDFFQVLIPVKKLDNKHADQLYKLREALPSLPDEFYVMNDDFFLVAPMQDDGGRIGDLTELQTSRKIQDDYYVAIKNTRLLLSDYRFTPYNFELHKPLFVVKRELEYAFTFLDGAIEPALLWRSLYGTCAMQHGVFYTEAKTDTKNIKFGESWCLSTDGFSFPRYRHKLKEVLNG